MSELLDERVVEMRFDNADFERNVGQSIKTINKLKESLDFDDAGQSFDNLAASAAKVDLSPMEESIEKIAVKFNMLELVAANVLSNIVNKAVNAGMQFAKSVSTDQVTAGWSKYQRKTEAVQTIIAATGESIDFVNKKLEKLIWFADETSYDFVDMVNNIGKFTSAGIELDTAVNSMMGISNWAAISGAGIQQASRAMYNLSQSIGMGYVAIQDWKSIELANMATSEFKETAIAMALELGTLKQINGEITTLDGKVQVTAETMRESLKKKWFTSDVLNATLNIYADFANKVKEFQETHEGFDTVSRAMEEMIKTGEIDLGDPFQNLAYRAFTAAQEAKTLTEAINATKDAVSSGWMRTFELIFGNYNQAKKLWTSLANDLYDIFAAPGDARNEKLADIMKSNYQKMLDEMPDPDEFNTALYNKLYKYVKTNRGEEIAQDMFSKFESIEELLKNVNFYDSELKSVIKDISKDNSLELKRVSELSHNLKNKQTSLKQIAIRLAANQFGADEETARKNLEKIGWDYDEVLKFAEAWKNGVEIDWDAEQKNFEEYLDERYSTLLEFNQKLSNFDLFSGLREFGGRDKLVASYENIMSFFKNFYLLILGVGDGIGSLFGNGGSPLSTAIDGFYKLTSVLGDAGTFFEQLLELSNALFGFIIPESWDRFLHGYDVDIEMASLYEQTEHIPGLIDRITTYYEEHLKTLPEEVQNTIKTITGNVTEFFNSIPERVKKLRKDILGVEKEYINLNADGKWETKIIREGGIINEWKTQLESFGDGIIPKALNGISNFLNRISGYLFGYKNDAGEFEGIITWIYNKVQSFINLLKTIGKNAKDIFNTVLEDIKTFFTGGKYSFSNATIWSFPSRLKKHFEDLKNTPAFQEIKRFFLGEIAPDGTIIKNNIFGKISRVVTEFVSSKPFQDVKAFFFGKEANTQTFGQAARIPGLFEKIGNFVKNLVTSVPYQEIKKFILGDIESGEPSIFGKISGAIQSIKESTAYKSIHDFFFGNEESDIPNLFGKIRGLFESIEASAPFQAVRAVIDFLTGKQSFSSTLGEIKDIFMGREGRQRVSKGGDTLVDKLMGANGGIFSVIFGGDIEHEITDAKGNVIGTVTKNVDGIITDISKFIGSIPERITATVQETKNKIFRAVGSIFGIDTHNLYGLGKEYYDVDNRNLELALKDEYKNTYKTISDILNKYGDLYTAKDAGIFNDYVDISEDFNLFGEPVQQIIRKLPHFTDLEGHIDGWIDNIFGGFIGNIRSKLPNFKEGLLELLGSGVGLNEDLYLLSIKDSNLQNNLIQYYDDNWEALYNAGIESYDDYLSALKSVQKGDDAYSWLYQDVSASVFDKSLLPFKTFYERFKTYIDLYLNLFKFGYTGNIDFYRRISEDVEKLLGIGNALGEDAEKVDVTQSAFVKLGAIVNSVREFASKAKDKIIEFGTAVFGALNNARKWLGLDWDFVKLEDGTSKWQRIPGAIDDVAKVLKDFLSSPAVVGVKEFLFGNKEKGKDNIFGKISKTVSEFVSSKPFQDVKRFFLGEIAPDGTIIKNNIFGKISRIVSEFVSSKPFQDVKTFFFGKEANTQTFGQASHIPGIFEKISKTITDIVSSKEFQEIKKFFFGEKTSDGTIIKNNIFGKISRIISEFISINSGFANFHDFIFGNQELKQDNFLTRTINFISSKFEELKRMSPLIQEIHDFIEKKFHEIYVLFNGYDIYIPKMLETKHIPGKLEPIKNAIEEFFKKIKDLNPFKSNTKKQKGIFEIIGDFFKDITKLFAGIINGIQFLMRVPRLIHNLLPIFGGIAVLLLGIGGLNIGHLEIQSPLGNMVDMLTDVVKSVAIIAGLIVGLSVYLRFLDGTGWLCLAAAAVIIGAITWGLVRIAKEINGDDKKEKSGVIEGFQNAANMYFMISFIQALTSLIAALAISIAGLSFVAALTDPWYVIAAAAAVGAVIAAVGFAIKLMNDSFDKSKDVKGKLHTHAGELFGLAFVLFSIANLLSTIVIAFSWLYFLTKGKTIKDFETPLILIGGILTAITVLIAVMGRVIKSISKAGGISKKSLAALGSLELFILMLSTLVTVISVGNHWESVAAMFLGITFVLLAMGRLLKIISSIKDVKIKPVLVILSITAVLGALVVGLLALANALKVDIDFKRIFNLMASIVEMAVAFGLVAVVIGAIGEFAHSLKNFSFGGTLLFIGKVVGIVTIIAAAVILIAGLIAKIEGAKEYIEGAGEILEALSEALGKLVGGFIGGIGEGITDSMPDIATNLSDFMTNLAPFLDGIKNVKQGHARGMGYLVELMLGITGTELLSAFNGLIEITTGWITGGNNLDNAFGLLSRAAEGLAEFSSKVKDVSYRDVKHAAKIIPALLDIAVDDNYKTGGIAGAISWIANGSVDFKGLFEKLNNGAADGLREFESKVRGLTYEDVEAAADVIPALLNIAVDDRYKRGGISKTISSIVNGSVDLKGLFDKLNDGAADGLKTFESKVKGLTYDDVKAAADVIPALLNIATDYRYRSGGFFDGVSNFVNGSVDLGALFEKLNNGAADGLKTFESKVKGLTYDDVKAAADVIPALLNIATNPNYRSGSKWDIISEFLTGNVNLNTLFNKLNNGAAQGLVTFANTVTGFNYDDAKAAAEIIPALLNIASDENYKSGGISEFLDSFINGSINFEELFEKLNDEIVPGFVDFAGALQNVTLDKAERASEILPKILDMLSDDHYKSGGIGGWISKLIEGETNYQGMFDILLGEGKSKGLIDYLGELSEKLKSKELVDLDFSAVNNAVDAMKNVFELMSFDTSNLIVNTDQQEEAWGNYSFFNDATKLSNALTVLREKVVPEIGKLQEDLEAAGVKSSYISSIIGSYSELIRSLIDLSKFDGMIGAPEIGNYVIEGLVNALRAGETRVEDAARGVANAVQNGLTLTLQIQSPSKVAYKIGQFVAEGLTIGLRDGEPLAESMARQLGEGTIKALKAGAERYDAYGLSQHAINMITEDLVDEHIFDMPDFSFTNRLGMEDIDFEAMRKFMQEKFGEVLDPKMINGFVNSYMKEFNELPKEIKDSDYAKVMTDIAKGEYGLGQDTIIDALEEELGSVSAAEQAWEDYNDVLKGNIKINKDLLKQKKENPPMTYEEYMAMVEHEQKGIELANKGFFDDFAKANGVTREEAMSFFGYDPKITQNALNQMTMNSQEMFDAWEKRIADQALADEEAKLLREWEQYVLGIGNTAADVNQKIETETTATTETLDKTSTRIDKSVKDVVKKFRKGQKLTEKEIKAFLETTADPNAKPYDSFLKALQIDQTDFNKYIDESKRQYGLLSKTEYYDKLDPAKLNDLLKRIQNGATEISKADSELLKSLTIATQTEGKFGVGVEGREKALTDFGIDKKYATLARKLASDSNIDEYIKKTYQISDANKEAEESADSLLNNASKEWKEVYSEIEKAISEAANKGLESFELDPSMFKSLGEDWVSGLTDIFGEVNENGKFKINFKDLSSGILIGGKPVKNPQDFINALGMDNIITGVLNSITGGNLFSDLGGLPKLDELNFKDIFKDIKSAVTDLHFFELLPDWMSNSFKSVLGIDEAIDDINEKGLDLHADTSEITQADNYLQSILDKYKLSKDEETIAMQGYKNLINGDFINTAQKAALEKLWQGMTTGSYGAQMQEAIKIVLDTMGISWDVLNSYFGPGGHSMLEQYTTDALKYAEEIKNTKELGTDYTIKDLIHDAHDKGAYGTDAARKKAWESMNIDYEKAMQVYSDYLKYGDDIFDKTKADARGIRYYAENYAFLTDAEIEALKAQERIDTALASTPEGAFAAIGDFLKGVNQVLESDDTAENFTKFVTSITDSMKSLNLDNAPAFKQIGDFLKMVQQTSNASTNIITDFGPMFQSIADSINSVELNTEQFQPIADFLTGVLDLSESAKDFINPFKELVTSLIEMPEGDASAKAGETARIIVETILQAFRERYDDFTEIGANFVIQLITGMLSQRDFAIKAANSVSTSLLTAFQQQAVDKASKYGQDFTTALSQGIASEESVTGLKNALNSLFGIPTEGAEGMTDQSAGAMASLGETFGKTFGTDFVTGFGSSVAEQQDLLSTQLQPVIDGLTGITSAFTTIEDPGAAITNFVSSIGRASEEVIDSESMASIELLAGQIESIISSAVPDGYGMGWNFVEGLYLGLLDGWNAYGDMISGLSSGMGTTATDALGKSIQSNSPSRATRRLGGYFVEGFMIGLQNGVKNIYSSSVELADASLDGIIDTVGIHSPGVEPQRLGEIGVAGGYGLGIENGKSYVYQASEDLANASMAPMSIMTQNAPKMGEEFVTNFGDAVSFAGYRNNPFTVISELAQESSTEAVHEVKEASDLLNAVQFKAPGFNDIAEIPHKFMTPLQQAAAKTITTVDDLDESVKQTANDILDLNETSQPTSMMLPVPENAYIAAGNALRQFGHVSGEEAKLLQEVWDDVMRGVYGVIGDPNKDRDKMLLDKINMTWAEFSKYDPMHNGNFDLTDAINGTVLPAEELEVRIHSVKDLVYAIWDGSLGIGDTIRKDIVEGLGYSYDIVKKLVYDLKYNPGSINWDEAEKDASSQGNSIGNNVVSGVAKGLKSRIIDLKNQTVQMVSTMTGKATEILGIQSPSKVFMEYGQYVVEGLAIGIGNNTYLAENSITDLSNVLTNTFNESTISLADLVETDLNTDPVITPVIDMSNVYDSASDIDAMLSREQAIAISTSENAKRIQNGEEMEAVGATYNFTQNNYSPKALSRAEIYRQTKNQFALLKGV